MSYSSCADNLYYDNLRTHMGTRADFYIGRGEKAEWIASIAWDGCPESERVARVLKAASESTFNKRVAELERGSDDFTGQAEGWPWPWETSATTDFAYAWDDGSVYVSMFGSKWLSRDELMALRAAQKAWEDKLNAAEKDASSGELPVMDEEQPEWPENPAATFPNMKTDKMATPGSKRSGITLIGLK